jgi:hypothetical protein
MQGQKLALRGRRGSDLIGLDGAHNRRRGVVCVLSGADWLSEEQGRV